MKQYLIIIAVFVSMSISAQNTQIRRENKKSNTEQIQTSSKGNTKSTKNTNKQSQKQNTSVNKSENDTQIVKNEDEAFKMYLKSFQLVEAEQYESALTIINEGLQLAEESSTKALLYDNMAYAYYNLGNLEKAISSCISGLSEDMENSQLQYNLGVFYYEDGKYDLSTKAFEHLFYIAQTQSVPIEFMSGAYGYMGDIKYSQKQLPVAEEYLKKAIDSSSEPNSVRMQTTYAKLCELYYDQKKYNDAITYLEKSISLEEGKLNFIERYHKIASCYRSLNDVEKSIDAEERC